MGFLGSAARWLGFGPIDEVGYSSQFADPGDHLAQITMADWLGTLPDHVAVTRKNAMTVATVAAARNTVAGVLGRLPLVASQAGIRGRVVNQQLLEQPERGVPISTTMTWTVDALFFHPCTWWVIRERDVYGWPVWVEWVSRDRADLDSAGRLIRVDRQPVAPEDVIRFDSPLGEGFLKNARRNIQRAVAIDLAASLAEDSPIPALELHNESGVELSTEQTTKLLDDWTAARRKRGVAYTPRGIKVIPHGKPVEQLLIDARKAISLDLIRQANLPAWAASTAIEGATMTYDNRSLRNWELIDLGLASFMTAIGKRLSMPDVTPRGWEITVDADALTQPDQKTRFETYRTGLEAGFIDRAWIAAQEGWAAPMGDAA